MALSKTYTDDFERLWKAYPKWPTGRSKKHPSYLAFAKAKKFLQFTTEDIDAIEADIDSRLKSCVTWEKGNKFGPVMFATYFNQMLWNEPYEKVKGHAHKPTAVTVTDEDNKRAWVLDLQRKGLEIPIGYERYLDH